LTFSNDYNADLHTIYHGSGIRVKCVEDVIKYRFDTDAFDGAFVTNAMDMTVQLVGVQDEAGNLMSPGYQNTTTWDRSVLDPTSTSFLSGQDIPAGMAPQMWHIFAAMAGLNMDNDNRQASSLIPGRSFVQTRTATQSTHQCPPKIQLKHSAAVDTLDKGVVTVINSPTFSSLSDAVDYLESVVETEDDCASGLQLNVVLPTDINCEDTILNVVATDSCCPNHELQSNRRQFKVKVDTEKPTVSIEFGRNDNYSSNEIATNVTYLHIPASDSYENVQFSYSVIDNCAQTLRTKITVSSNEFEYDESMSSDNMVLMRKTKGAGQSHGVKVFVAPKQCQSDSSQSLCENDSNSDFRYYQFDVEATDFAGNVGKARAFVVIVPDGYDDASTDPGRFINTIENSTHVLNVIQTLDMPWSFGIFS